MKSRIKNQKVKKESIEKKETTMMKLEIKNNFHQNEKFTDPAQNMKSIFYFS